MPVKRRIGTAEMIIISPGRLRRVHYEIPGLDSTGLADAVLFRDLSEVRSAITGFVFQEFALHYDVPTTFYIFEDPETGEEYICDEGGKERLELVYR